MTFEISLFRNSEGFRIYGYPNEGGRLLSSYVEDAARVLYFSLVQKVGVPLDYHAVESHVMDRLYKTLSITAGIARTFNDHIYPNEEAVERVTRNIPVIAMKHFEHVLMKVIDAGQVH